MIDRNFTKALPVLFGFFVMGFCDVAGIATSYIKNDFSLSETVAGSILLMKMNDVAYFRANIILALVGATGFFCSSIFSINQRDFRPDDYGSMRRCCHSASHGHARRRRRQSERLRNGHRSLLMLPCSSIFHPGQGTGRKKVELHFANSAGRFNRFSLFLCR